MKNQFSDFYFSSYCWLYLQFTGDSPGFSSVFPTKKSFKGGKIYRKDAQGAETIEKYILAIFIFSVIVAFVLKILKIIYKIWVEKLTYSEN